MIWMFTPVSGHGASSRSKSMTVARRGCARAGASAAFITNGSSIGEQRYFARGTPRRAAPPARETAGAGVQGDAEQTPCGPRPRSRAVTTCTNGPRSGGCTPRKIWFTEKYPGLLVYNGTSVLYVPKPAREHGAAQHDNRGSGWRIVVSQECSPVRSRQRLPCW